MPCLRTHIKLVQVQVFMSTLDWPIRVHSRLGVYGEFDEKGTPGRKLRGHIQFSPFLQCSTRDMLTKICKLHDISSTSPESSQTIGQSHHQHIAKKHQNQVQTTSSPMVWWWHLSTHLGHPHATYYYGRGQSSSPPWLWRKTEIIYSQAGVLHLVWMHKRWYCTTSSMQINKRPPKGVDYMSHRWICTISFFGW